MVSDAAINVLNDPAEKRIDHGDVVYYNCDEGLPDSPRASLLSTVDRVLVKSVRRQGQ